MKEKGRNEMIFVKENSSLNAAHWITHISLCSYCGTESKLREASERNRKLAAPLIALLYLLPLKFFSSFFSPSIPQGGWVTANPIERQINKEIYCHLRAPPS